MQHKLDLLDNALDSFNEALVKYQCGNSGEHRSYKFAILHFSHFVELLFKQVSLAHPLLVYRNPFSKNIKNEQTIGLWEAIQFFRNTGEAFNDDFYSDIQWLKELRNNIEHYQFEMDVGEVKESLGRLTFMMNEFCKHFKT